MPLLIARQLRPTLKPESCAVVISLFLTFVAASCNVIVYTEEVESNGTVGIYAGSPRQKNARYSPCGLRFLQAGSPVKAWAALELARIARPEIIGAILQQHLGRCFPGRQPGILCLVQLSV